MKVVALKSFSYASDGINAVPIAANDEVEIDDDLIPGLMKEGFVRGNIASAQVPSQSSPQFRRRDRR